MLCCLARSLLELTEQHVRACTPMSYCHRGRELLSILGEAFRLQWWVIFSSGVLSPHPSMSANMKTLTYRLPEDSNLES